MCKNIHLKGTFTKILEEIQQVVFEKKLIEQTITSLLG